MGFRHFKAVDEEEKAGRDAVREAEDLRAAEVQLLVDQYFRCAKPEHYGDFNLHRKRELRGELEQLGVTQNWSSMTWETNDGLSGAIQNPLESISDLHKDII